MVLASVRTLQYSFLIANLIFLSLLTFLSVAAEARVLSCTDLLSKYRASQTSAELKSSSSKLVFAGVGGRDVYNPTKPFQVEFLGQQIEVLAARVEARDSEESEAMFFVESAGVWSPLPGSATFKMQDPFFTFINGELIFGGVETFPKPGGGLGYKTIFYRGHSLEKLAAFTEGPAGMKDIRLVQLSREKIGVFTRPQGLNSETGIDGGRGKIGYTEINGLENLTAAAIVRAPLLENHFHESEWGGVNEAQVLPDGRVAVLAHVANFDREGNRHYYSAVFTMDARSHVVSPFEIILERGDLAGGLTGISKRKDLMDVVFSGGLRLSGDHATIFVGAGDAEVHAKRISMPKSFK